MLEAKTRQTFFQLSACALQFLLLFIFIVFELDMTGHFLFYCKWGIQTSGEKALYCDKCCSLAVRGSWLHEIVTELFIAWQWVRTNETTSVVLL